LVSTLFKGAFLSEKRDQLNVCAGAFDDGGAPANIIQRGVPQGIIRNTPNVPWETHENLLAELQKAL
jgi:hypothetical protein